MSTNWSSISLYVASIALFLMLGMNHVLVIRKEMSRYCETRVSYDTVEGLDCAITILMDKRYNMSMGENVVIHKVVLKHFFGVGYV